MLSASFPRLVLRQSRLIVQRRAASSTTEAATDAASSGANKAKEGASQAAGQAQQGLSRVTSSAGSAMTSASSVAGKAVAGIGGRTGRMINFVQGMVPPTIYYARVVGELGKIIYRGRGMQPPNMQTVQSYMTPVTNALRNPSSLATQTAGVAESTASTAVNNPQSFLTRLRNLDSATLTSAAVIGAETIGFFCIGEMIGRLKIIGYRGGHSEHH
ncbi:ATP synthase subunit G atp20 [Saxophila tyrrhenica]|uniref:ATP synthase subunit G atp20 n=1 Tax=Saxophila tyrrhenica TaxID=1690608 RepID=A0AAV9PCR7_9PEZI|nr:ATP synthase subunit G atp20 [Saxophila tyrrhenica]